MKAFISAYLEGMPYIVAPSQLNLKRVDALTVKYTAKNMAEAYKTFELLVFAAGVSFLLNEQI